MKLAGFGIPELMITFVPGLIIGIICCIVAVNFGKKKGYSSTLCGLLGFFLGIIGLIIVLVLPSKNQTMLQNYESAETLQRYKNLLDEGAITQEEYDRKKTEILNS